MLRTTCCLAALALVACDDEPRDGNPDTLDGVDADATDGDRPDAPTPWIYPADTAEPAPTLSATARQEAIEVAMSAALELEPRLVKDVHEALFPTPAPGSGSTTGCPLYLTFDYGTAKAFYWQGECTDAAGTRYSGQGYVATYDDFTNEAGTFDGYEVNLAGRLEAADGTFLEGAGRAGGYAGGAGDLAAVSLVIEGTFVAGGPRAPSSPWLDGTRRPSLTVTGLTYVPTGGTNVTVQGGISGLDFPPGVTAVSLDELTAREVLAGASCERELGGAAAVRDDTGNWFDVLFDGPLGEQGATPAELCDGCGATWFRGRDVEPTCVDARAYFEWDGAP